MNKKNQSVVRDNTIDMLLEAQGDIETMKSATELLKHGNDQVEKLLEKLEEQFLIKRCGY